MTAICDWIDTLPAWYIIMAFAIAFLLTLALVAKRNHDRKQWDDDGTYSTPDHDKATTPNVVYIADFVRDASNKSPGPVGAGNGAGENSQHNSTTD